MIKLKLKFDVSFRKLAIVCVGSVACYCISHIISGLVRPVPQEKNKDISKSFFIESKINKNDNNRNTNKIQLENSNIKCIGAFSNHLVKNKNVIKRLRNNSSLPDKNNRRRFLSRTRK